MASHSAPYEATVPAPDSFAHSMLLLLVLTVVQRSLGFGRSVLFCRMLDVETLGRWDLIFGFLELVTPIAVLSIPACFNRYTEHYRQRGELRGFLARTVPVIGALVGCSACAMIIARGEISFLLFGQRDATPLIVAVAICLPWLVLYATLTELFSGFRRYRVVSTLQFTQSVSFAVFSLAAIFWLGGSVTALVMSYGLACLVCTVAPVASLVFMWRRLPREELATPLLPFWRRLAPFVASVWLSNWLGNAFMVVDRWMIVHFANVSPDEAQRLIGQYHSSRILPLLLISVVGLLTSMALPYLSHDWEAGHGPLVSKRLNLFLKLTCLTLCGVSIALLGLAPWLFTWAFADKFSAGLVVLPGALLYGVWFAMFCVAKLYLWCDERVYLSGVALLIGLLTNVAMNAVWLPMWGLAGAVAATCIANATLLGAIYALAAKRGFVLQGSTLALSVLPLALLLPPWWAVVVYLGICVVGMRTSWIVDATERREIRGAVVDVLSRYRPTLVDELTPRNEAACPKVLDV